jgi:hypothetical protein
VTPAWVPDAFAAVMLAVTAVSAVRLAAARPWRRPDADIDAGHLVMGVAMAGMLTPGLRTLPGGAWAVICGLLTAWFGCALWREARGRGVPALAAGHHAPHLLHGAAMLYTFLALTVPPAGAVAGAMPVLRLPALALIFALLLAGYTVRDLDLLSGHATGAATIGHAAGTATIGHAAGAATIGRAAGTAVICRVAMGLTMAFMMVMMI